MGALLLGMMGWFSVAAWIGFGFIPSNKWMAWLTLHDVGSAAMWASQVAAVAALIVALSQIGRPGRPGAVIGLGLATSGLLHVAWVVTFLAFLDGILLRSHFSDCQGDYLVVGCSTWSRALAWAIALGCWSGPGCRRARALVPQAPGHPPGYRRPLAVLDQLPGAGCAL